MAEVRGERVGGLRPAGMLERPDGGQVEICGVRNPRLTSRPGRELLRRRVAYLFQNGALIDDATVAANLRVAMHATGRRRRDEAHRMRAALRRVGLDVPLNQPVATLSGGEQQRLAFARILLRPVEVLLADEPTGSLDEGNRDALLQLLRDLNHEGTTVVVVTHDPAVERACQRSIRLKGPVRSARRPEVAPTAETASTRTSGPDGSQQLGDADAK